MKNGVMRAFSGLVIGCVFLITLFACASVQETFVVEEYKHSVGDIEYNASVDDSTFKRCHSVENTAQYFNFSDGFRYKGEKRELINLFQSQYKPIKRKKQNGYIRIRFVVNCKGESGQFRVLQSNKNFEPFEFHPKVVSQLLEITKSLDGWLVVNDDINGPRDYYQYLIFKMKDGKIEDLMP